VNLKNIDAKQIRRWTPRAAITAGGGAAVYFPAVRAALSEAVAEATSYPVLAAFTLLMLALILSIAFVIVRMVDAGIFLDVLQRFCPTCAEPPPKKTKDIRNKKTKKKT
jgi:hypothetical protein